MALPVHFGHSPPSTALLPADHSWPTRGTAVVVSDEMPENHKRMNHILPAQYPFVFSGDGI